MGYRYIQDHPSVVRGRRVLDFASGCGIAGFMARLHGADHVVLNDIDPYAIEACKLNADINKLSIDEYSTTDLIGSKSDGSTSTL